MNISLSHRLPTARFVMLAAGLFLSSLLGPAPFNAAQAKDTPQSKLVKELKKQGKSATYVAKKLKKKFKKLKSKPIVKLLKAGRFGNKPIAIAMKGPLKIKTGPAIRMVRDVLGEKDPGRTARLLRHAKYRAKDIVNALRNVLKTSYADVAKILKSFKIKDSDVAKTLKNAGLSRDRILSAGKQGLRWSGNTAAGILKNTLKQGPGESMKLLKKAKYSAMDGARAAKEVFGQSRSQAEKLLRNAKYQARDITKAIAAFYKDTKRELQSYADGTVVGPAENCGTQNYGNQTGRKDKFDAFATNSRFWFLNAYLMMQASGKNYYQQLRSKPYKGGQNVTGPVRPTNESTYRCAAEELYHYWGFDEVYFANSEASGNVIIAKNERMVLINVRGTEDLDPTKKKAHALKGAIDILATGVNVLRPANIRGQNFGKIHSGYSAVIGTLAPRVMKALTKLKVGVLPAGAGPSGTPIFVTGHSLGGATATLLAFALKMNRYRVEAAYVFAAPKVGDFALAQSIRKHLALYAFANYRDPVPLIPKYTANRPDGDYASVMDAARKSIYFDQDHKAVTFELNPNTSLSNLRGEAKKRDKIIARDQGVGQTIKGPRGKRAKVVSPKLLGGSSITTSEWKFHNTNFYLAYAYGKLDSSQKEKVGPPELNGMPMGGWCYVRSESARSGKKRYCNEAGTLKDHKGRAIMKQGKPKSACLHYLQQDHYRPPRSLVAGDCGSY